ncbi:serine hydrolase domain-containing protein [Megasphaera elsdenii]|uniref:Serine hydrolase n=1 Tax=Megasphaera elsdenii TaxID=907 RepID=A0A2S0M405_MEGEL|nr:serine hydrolase domain-containing protein [Megasphaera elsdenii]AVO26168.1 serine hydrolase [Megasphaera elsdenii]
MKRRDWDGYFASLIGDSGTCVPGLAVLAYAGGREVYRFAGGIRRMAGAQTWPMTEDSRFRMASVSKMFTVFTIMQLAEAGKLSLDEDVSEYLGFRLRHPSYPDVPVTLRQLASHTSGLRDGKVYSIPPSVSVRAFFTPGSPYWEGGAHFAPAGQAPGAYFTYCNLNYGLLGTVIEAVTGQRFDQYQKTHILKDLDCRADYVSGNLEAPEFARLGTIYRKQDRRGRWEEKGPWQGIMDDFGGVQPPRETLSLQNPYAQDVCQTYDLAGYQPGTNATIFSPQGGLRLSLEELGHVLAMLLHDGRYAGRQVLRPASLQAMFSPQWTYDGHNGDTCGQTLLTYGLGEFFVDGRGPARCCRTKAIDLWGHTGQAFGLLSGLFIRPGTGSGFAYVMNGEALAEDDDPRSAGQFSRNYIWEEKVMDGLCRLIDGL